MNRTKTCQYKAINSRHPGSLMGITSYKETRRNIRRHFNEDFPVSKKEIGSKIEDSPVHFPPFFWLHVTEPSGFVWTQPEVISKISKHPLLARHPGTVSFLGPVFSRSRAKWRTSPSELDKMRQLFRRFASYIAMSSYEVNHNVKGREFYITLEKGR